MAVRVLASCGRDARLLRQDLRAAMGGDPPGSFHMGRARAEREPADSKLLEQFTRDLTRQAASGGLDPVVGREEEIDRVVQILSRRRKNNPALIGEPGVGKTAVAEGLARRLAARGRARRPAGANGCSLWTCPPWWRGPSTGGNLRSG